MSYAADTRVEIRETGNEKNTRSSVETSALVTLYSSRFLYLNMETSLLKVVSDL